MQSKQTFSISDVSQITGVAAITLRAWERRYGLVKPERTPKGHRVFTQENIDEIKQIVAWLNRGVAIGKVAPLLANNITNEADLELDEQWQERAEAIMDAVMKLHFVRANQLVDNINKSMPFDTLVKQLYVPLSLLLKKRWHYKPLGYELEHQLWQQLWQRQVTLTGLRAEKQKSRCQCWLVSLDDETQDEYWFLTMLLMQSGVRVYSIHARASLPSIARIPHIKNTGLILYGDHRQKQLTLSKLTELHQNWKTQLMFIGKMLEIHDDLFHRYDVDAHVSSVDTYWTLPTFQSWFSKLEESNER
jgi:DNA-binding transcriptional MerR regulator